MSQRLLLHEQEHKQEPEQQIAPKKTVVPKMPSKQDQVAEIEALLARLQRGAIKRKKGLRYLPYMGACFAAMCVFFALLFQRSIQQEIAFPLWLVPPILLGAFVLIGNYHVIFAPTQEEKEAARNLTQYDDIRAVKPLLLALTPGIFDYHLRPAILKALTRLTSKLDAESASSLPEDQQNNLNTLINNRQVLSYLPNDLVRNVVKTMGWIGNSHSLPVIEAFAVGKGRATQDRRLQEAAQNCLPLLRERVRQETSQQTLLRASDSSSTNLGTLLRPTQTAQDNHLQELLRPTSVAQGREE